MTKSKTGTDVLDFGSFGEALRARRAERGRTLADVCQVVGCSTSYLSDVEHGRRKSPGPETAALIAKALGERAADMQALALADRYPELFSNRESVLYLIVAIRESTT